MKREAVAGAGSTLFALLASSHHWLHMLLVTIGVGSGAFGAWMSAPGVRMFMMAMSLVMVAVMQIGYWRSKHRPMRKTLVVMISSALTLGLTWLTLAGASAAGGGHHNGHG